MILCIETSTNLCSVGLCSAKEVVFNRETLEGPNHASVLGVFIDEAINVARTEGMCIEAVAVSEGPGSYTGLRIGATMAKAVAYGLNVPLIAIPTLLIMAASAVELTPEIAPDDYICPMIDARRMEVYQAIFNGKLTEIKGTEPRIIDETSYNEVDKTHRIWFIGNGSAKCAPVMNRSNTQWLTHHTPLARFMPALAFAALGEKKFVDTAYFTPNYVKDFTTTTPKNKVI